MDRFNSDIAWRMDQIFGGTTIISKTFIGDVAKVIDSEASRLNMDTNNISDGDLTNFISDMENGEIEIDWTSVLRRPIRQLLVFNQMKRINKNEI